MIKYKICTTNIERAHFLAQCEHESGGFRYKQEIWGPTAAQSGYEGRDDLGNLQKGDGYKFRGRGYIQLTGRANYRKFGRIAGADFEGNPDSVATQYFADTACMFWKTNSLVTRCKDSTTTSIKLVTKKNYAGGIRLMKLDFMLICVHFLLDLLMILFIIARKSRNTTPEPKIFL